MKFFSVLPRLLVLFYFYYRLSIRTDTTHKYALFVHTAKGTRFSLLAFRLSKNEILQRSEYRAYHTCTYNIMYTAILSTLRGKK